MSLARTIVRILVGIVFVLAGASAFFVAPPPVPGLAGEFMDSFARSHWNWFVAVAQVAGGLLLAIDRLVPLALIMLGAFLYNSIAFHLTMMPATLFVPIVATALLSFVAWPYRSRFADLFNSRAD